MTTLIRAGSAKEKPMAHFTNAQGIRISGQNLQVQIGESAEIGLWGFRDFDGQPLSVTAPLR
jgi:hypothetical protein